MTANSEYPDREYIPITRPFLGEEEVQAASEVIRSGWLAQGSRVSEFERSFAAYIGLDDAVAISSCTTALNLALVQMRPKAGDEVLIPAFTWVATANAVELVGATPVFVDIDPETFNIDPGAAEAAITERTVGMVPVHLFGMAAPMDALLATARQHGLWVVEDAACALGTTISDAHVGTFGDIGCFSFHPRKSITTGEGGMVVARNENELSTARSLRNHGVTWDSPQPSGGDLPDHPVVGFNYRMTDLQAAIGIVQMSRLDQILARRRQIAALYDTSLADVQWLRRPALVDGHSYQAYVGMVSGEGLSHRRPEDLNAARGSLLVQLEQRGIGARPGTHAPVRMTYYREKYGLSEAHFPNAIAADRQSIALPLFAGMTDEQVDFVVTALREAVLA
jgi:dTDP-4-amino-4,6-dideoxygalactose transaminase